MNKVGENKKFHRGNSLYEYFNYKYLLIIYSLFLLYILYFIFKLLSILYYINDTENKIYKYVPSSIKEIIINSRE